jgi:hypothetical protein
MFLCVTQTLSSLLILTSEVATILLNHVHNLLRSITELVQVHQLFDWVQYKRSPAPAC